MKKQHKMTQAKIKNRYCIRHIRDAHVFTEAESADSLGKHISTIRGWIRQGVLRTIDKKKPRLIHGSDLKICCESVNQRRRVKIRLGEMLCNSCKDSRAAEAGSIEKVYRGKKRPYIRAKCAECAKGLHMICSLATIEEKFNIIEKRSKRLRELSDDHRPVNKHSSLLHDWIQAYNSENERLKHRYLDYLHEAKRYSAQSIGTVEKDLLRFERFTNFASYKDFNRDTAKAYKKHLKSRGYSLYTIRSSLVKLAGFLRWLKEQTGYKRTLHYTDIDYLNLTNQELRATGMRRLQRYPSLEQIARALLAMPVNTPKERRDRAMIALLVLTGMRDGSAPALCIKHIDLEKRLAILDPLEVSVKCGQYTVTRFLPVPESIFKMFKEYYIELIEVHKLGPTDPLFPKLELKVGEEQEYVEGEFSRECLKDAQILARVCKKAFASVNVEPYSPHKIRHTLLALGKSQAKTAEEIKAWSQNIGHASCRHMMDTYGQMGIERQIEIMSKFSEPT